MHPRHVSMTSRLYGPAALIALTVAGPGAAVASPKPNDHVHLTSSNTEAVVVWCTEYMGCEDIGRTEACPAPRR